MEVVFWIFDIITSELDDENVCMKFEGGGITFEPGDDVVICSICQYKYCISNVWRKFIITNALQ